VPTAIIGVTGALLEHGLKLLANRFVASLVDHFPQPIEKTGRELGCGGAVILIVTQLIETAWSHHPRLSSFKPEIKKQQSHRDLRGAVDNLAAKKIVRQQRSSRTKEKNG